MHDMRAYKSAFFLQMQSTLCYRANILFYLTAVLIPPLAIFFLWRTVLGEVDALGAYDLGTMITYYVVVQFFIAHTPFSAWVEIGESIRDGSLTLWLVRPANHYGLYLGRLLGSWVPFWLLGLGGTAGVAALLHRYFQFQTDPVLIGAAVLMWLGGVILGFTWGYMLNLVAFWTERATGMVVLAEQAASFLAGGVIPLDLLPLQELWLFLPFRFAGWLPTQIYLGRVSRSELPLEFLKLLIWLMAFCVLVQWLWRRGLRRFAGVGV